MSQQNRKDFFKEVKEHSHVKLTAVRRYLRPWSAAVGSQQRPVKRIWVVDGFAGAGTYESGEIGSPGLALEEARYLNGLGRRYRMACLFFENDRRNHEKLARLCATYRDVECIPAHGNFWAKLKLVEEIVGDDPCFVFVDPFGLGDLDFQVLVTLCSKLKQVDLMVNLASPAAKRLQPEHSALVSRAVGGDDWTTETVSEAFCARLTQQTGLRTVSLPVTANLGELKYEVILGARHPRAFELWNDEIARRESEILNGDDQAEKAKVVNDAQQLLLEFTGGRKTFQRDRLISEVTSTRCGDGHSRSYRAAVENLIKDGIWTRGPGPVGAAWISR